VTLPLFDVHILCDHSEKLFRHLFGPGTLDPLPGLTRNVNVESEHEGHVLSHLDFKRLGYNIEAHVATAVWAIHVVVHHRLGDTRLAKHMGASTHFDGILDVI
jgi:hypothetical protein